MSIAKVAYVAHVPGHKNSKGESAPWVIKDHKDDHIISSFATESAAKAGLQNMHAHEGSLKTARPLHLEELRAWANSPEEGRKYTEKLNRTAATASSLDDFTRAYIEAALATSNDESDESGGHPLDQNYGVEDLAPSTLQAMINDCKRFQEENAEALAENGDIQGGHDFWLTRAGHGAGFWDGDWPVNGKALTLASKKYREPELYVGDDGYIYQGGTETPGPVAPRESFEELTDTPEGKNWMDALKIRGSLKQAVWVEEQWADILQKKGYAIDETAETGASDTLYINSSIPDVQVLLHESNEPYYIVELNGELIEQNTDPEKLWNILSKIPQLYRESIKHPRELNENDMKEMGIIAHIKSGLLRKKEPKMAFDFTRNQPRQYDYEASGHDVVLISPANTTKLLEGDEARAFWVALDHIEGSEVEAPEEEYQKRIQDLIRSYFDRDRKAASFVVQVDASSLKKSASVAFIAGVTTAANGVVEKLKFTTNKANAEKMSQRVAKSLVAQLSDFRLTGKLVAA